MALRAHLDVTPEKNADAEAGMLAVLTKMMLVLPGQRTSELGAEATGEAYMESLDDIPTWAVAEAIRNWNRGQSVELNPRQPHDFRWRPAPAVLRKLAEIEAAKVRSRVMLLENLATSEERIEYTPEHCEQMRGKLRTLFSEMARGPESLVDDIAKGFAP
jgi:hypothetical protein